MYTCIDCSRTRRQWSTLGHATLPSVAPAAHAPVPSAPRTRAAAVRRDPGHAPPANQAPQDPSTRGATDSSRCPARLRHARSAAHARRVASLDRTASKCTAVTVAAARTCSWYPALSAARHFPASRVRAACAITIRAARVITSTRVLHFARSTQAPRRRPRTAQAKDRPTGEAATAMSTDVITAALPATVAAGGVASAGGAVLADGGRVHGGQRGSGAVRAGKGCVRRRGSAGCGERCTSTRPKRGLELS
jgi:hypothetical protein